MMDIYTTTRRKLLRIKHVSINKYEKAANLAAFF